MPWAAWGHALIAADVVLDSSANAMVVDVNTMSSFYHLDPEADAKCRRERGGGTRAWPDWFVEERSALIRTALDIVEETAWRKIRDRRAARAGVGGAASGITMPGRGARSRTTSWPPGEVLNASALAGPPLPGWPRLSKGVRTAESSGWQLLYNGARPPDQLDARRRAGVAELARSRMCV